MEGESCLQARPVNGGVPQAANLSAHLAELRRTVPLFIPDPEWDGMAVFDFEKWTSISLAFLLYSLIISKTSVMKLP